MIPAGRSPKGTVRKTAIRRALCKTGAQSWQPALWGAVKSPLCHLAGIPDTLQRTMKRRACTPQSPFRDTGRLFRNIFQSQIASHIGVIYMGCDKIINLSRLRQGILLFSHNFPGQTADIRGETDVRQPFPQIAGRDALSQSGSWIPNPISHSPPAASSRALDVLRSTYFI